MWTDFSEGVCLAKVGTPIQTRGGDVEGCTANLSCHSLNAEKEKKPDCYSHVPIEFTPKLFSPSRYIRRCFLFCLECPFKMMAYWTYWRIEQRRLNRNMKLKCKLSNKSQFLSRRIGGEITDILTDFGPKQSAKLRNPASWNTSWTRCLDYNGVDEQGWICWIHTASGVQALHSGFIWAL